MIFGYTMHRCLCTKHTVTDFPQNSTFSNLNLTMPLLLSIFTQNFTSLGLKVPSPRVAVHHALPEGIMHRTRNADHSILINNRLVLGSSTPKPPPSLLRKNVFYHPDEGTFFREINFTKIFTLVLWQYTSFFFADDETQVSAVWRKVFYPQLWLTDFFLIVYKFDINVCIIEKKTYYLSSREFALL